MGDLFSGPGRGRDPLSLLLYPGYHKTGTTLLQLRVLPGVGLDYLGRYYDRERRFHPKIGGELHGHLSDLARGTVRVGELAEFLLGLIQDDGNHILAAETLLRPASSGTFLEAVGIAAAAAPPGRLGVLLTLRHQADLLLSRYLHDLNTKVPAIRGAGWVLRALRRFRGGGPPYSLFQAWDEAAPPCHWPACDDPGRECPCARSGHLVSITPSFYDFSVVVGFLGEKLPEGSLAVVDLVDEVLRPEGIRRLCRLLARFGSEVRPADLAPHFLTPVNAGHGWTASGYSREDLDPEEVHRFRQAVVDRYRAGNKGLARAFPEFTRYLDPAWGGSRRR